MMVEQNPVVITGSNNKEAVFSFLRVLAVALAVAILPHIVAGQNGDPIVWREIAFAAASAALLTVINYFRKGEVRFGRTEPNVRRAEEE